MKLGELACVPEVPWGPGCIEESALPTSVVFDLCFVCMHCMSAQAGTHG